MSPHRRPQRLLMAPPGGGGRATTASPTTTPTPQPVHAYQNTAHSANIEELFDTPAETPQPEFKPDMNRQQAQIPQSNMMMNIIQDTNAQNRPNNNSAMQFPEMLSHYENSNGNSPLTNEQRNSMLNLMANTSSAGGNNALTSPTPPPPPTLEELGYTQKEIDELMRLQAEQEHRINDVKTTLAPLSPSGSIPGLDGDTYFNGMESSHPDAANLDLDQFLDTGAFYTGSSPMANNGDYSFDSFGDSAGLGESHFDVGMDGTNDNSGRVESLNGSTVATPEVSTPEDTKSMNGMRSPSKRRRKN